MAKDNIENTEIDLENDKNYLLAEMLDGILMYSILPKEIYRKIATFFPDFENLTEQEVYGGDLQTPNEKSDTQQPIDISYTFITDEDKPEETEFSIEERIQRPDLVRELVAKIEVSLSHDDKSARIKYCEFKNTDGEVAVYNGFTDEQRKFYFLPQAPSNIAEEEAFKFINSYINKLNGRGFKPETPSSIPLQ